MLKSLSVKNYALINSLYIEWSRGLSIITGETGAGKSILLGAIGLILGQRADTSMMKEDDKKCVVEAVFDISEYNLENFCAENDIDYDKNTIVRREIIPSGKSRAFINDVPVDLNKMKLFMVNLVDIHSQHENLNLNDSLFQLNVIDTIAGNKKLLREYFNIFKSFAKAEKDLKEFLINKEKLESDKDYLQFQYDKLKEINLEDIAQDELEDELGRLEHTEEIKSGLSKVFMLIGGAEEFNVNTLLTEAKSYLSGLTAYSEKISSFYERIDSSLLELSDLSSELETLAETTDFDPQRQIYIKDKLDALYSLQKKHNADSVDELINTRNLIEKQLLSISDSGVYQVELQTKMEKLKAKLFEAATEISTRRFSVIEDIQNKISELLTYMGMPKALFRINLETLDFPGINGSEKAEFLFTSNSAMAPKEISKIASGGEISRLMLAVKYLLCKQSDLPVIIFDEIDTGVSGDIADRMGKIIKEMSSRMQVINITHLPQIAAKADSHYLVFKNDNDNVVYTGIRKLSDLERIQEVAKMLSGERITKEALQNAKSLIG
jgi:DNA repair protein RecN (Recombination protein N)